MSIHLLTPLGLFRRVEDSWSPRKEIVLDKEAHLTRQRQQAASPIKLPTHEILSHAVVYPVHATTDALLGPCFLYEWLGPADGYSEIAVHFNALNIEQETRATLRAAAAAELKAAYPDLALPFRLEVSFQGSAFTQ
jgi:hypothetical protein